MGYIWIIEVGRHVGIRRQLGIRPQSAQLRQLGTKIREHLAKETKSGEWVGIAAARHVAGGFLTKTDHTICTNTYTRGD